MKITQVSSPADIKQPISSGQSVVEKAKAAFNDPTKVAAVKAALAGNPTTTPAQSSEPQIQTTAVRDPNHVSPEDLSALNTPEIRNEIRENRESSDSNAESSEATSTQDIRDRAKQDPEVQRRFNQLARQEKALRAQVQQKNIEFKKREAELKARETAIQSQQTQDLSNFIHKDKLRQDYLGTIEAAGGSYDELVQQVAAARDTDPRVLSTMQRMQERIDSLESQLEDGRKGVAQQQQQAYQTAIKQIRADATELVNADDNYTTIRDMKAVKDVVELIERKYKQDGTVLSVEKACDMVENYLIDEATRIANSRKVRERISEPQATAQRTEMKPQEKTQQQMKTLTNTASSNRPLTTRERAIAAFEGKLK